MPARLSRKTLAAIAAAVLSATTSTLSFAQTPAQRPPNIVFLLADDLGIGDVGCYGQKRIQTPRMDALARDGVKFTTAYAGSPVCAPSRCTLLTGYHTGHTLIRGNAKVSFGPKDLTVEEILKAAGYDTAAIGKWGVGEPGSEGTPAKKGFNYFYGYIDQTAAHNYYPTFLYQNEDIIHLRNVVPNAGQYGQGVATVHVDYSGDLCRDEILKYLQRVKEDQPFFLYVPFTAPHANNEAHICEVPDLGPYATNDWPDSEKHYAAIITRLDTYVGQIVDELKARHLDQNTLLIFTSDNGAHEEGGNKESFFGSSGGFHGIKRDLYEGGFREPMMAVWPGHLTPGSTTDQIFTFWDFLPTCAELAGAKIPPNLDGISLAPFFQGKPQIQQHEFLYWEFHERGFEQAVRHGDFKAVRHGLNQPLELYNLKDDIGETKNIAANNPDEIKTIETYLATARTDSPDFPIRPAGARGRGRAATLPAQ